MSTVINFTFPEDVNRPTLCDHFERADQYLCYLESQAQGVSHRQATKQLQVPRTTLQAWSRWHDSFNICPHVALFFLNGSGLAFLHRLVVPLHLVYTEVRACCIRLGCLFLNLIGLDRFVADSHGDQQQGVRQAETTIFAKGTPRRGTTLNQDEVFTGGLDLIGPEPMSNFLILESAELLPAAFSPP